MKPKFINRIHLNIPKPLIPKIDDFDKTAVQITNKAAIKAVEQIDDAIFNEIVAIARSEGIDDIYLLDKKNILSALEKQIPKKVEPTEDCCICPRCRFDMMGVYDFTDKDTKDPAYCPTCGQALLWEGDIE